MNTKSKVLAVALMAGGAMFAQPRLSIGIGVGGYGPGYYPPPAYSQYIPPCPGPDYAWVDGYWNPQGGRNVWMNGFWRGPSFNGYRAARRYQAPRYYNSYRGNDRGNDSYRGNDRGGYGDRYQNRGGGYQDRGERNGNRGNGNSNGFRR